jgi:hypothetical protein
MVKRIVSFIIILAIIIYLFIGVLFYVNSVEYGIKSIHLCPPITEIETKGLNIEPPQNCPNQTYSYIEHWKEGIISVVGWLPFLVFGNR